MLSYHARKEVLHLKMQNRALDEVSKIMKKTYKYIVWHMVQQFGNGSAHVGDAETVIGLHQHEDETVVAFHTRWLREWQSLNGTDFDFTVRPKYVKEFIRCLRDDQVKSRLLSLHLSP